MSADARRSESSSSEGTGTPPAPSTRVGRCSRCSAPTSKLIRQKLGLVPATSNAGNSNRSGGVAGRDRDYLCADCVRRERTAPVRLGYECPGWAYGRFGYRCPALAFRDEAPRVEALAPGLAPGLAEAEAAATYDIVFLAIDQRFGPRIHRRVAPGSTLTLRLEERGGGDGGASRARDENGDVIMADATSGGRPLASTSTSACAAAQTCLRGTVSMDRRSAIADAAWVDGMTFLAAPPPKSSSVHDEDGDDRDDHIVPPVSVAGFNHGGHLNFAGHELRRRRASPSQPHQHQRNPNPLRGQIRIVSSRAVVRARPDSKATAPRRGARPAIYSTAEEADAILRRHRASIAPFLGRNLGLPDGPARLVCEYWCERPSPLVEFLPGDVVLTTLLPGRGFMNDTISTVLVARRRHECCG